MPARLGATCSRSHGRVVGHSLGGGVALQFTYQFPEMADPFVRLLATPVVHRSLS